MTLNDLLQKHPTPWTAEPCGCTGCECRLIVSSKGDIITDIGDDLDDIAPIVAPLFAAAAEMLIVCEKLVEHCDRIGLEVELVRSIVKRAYGEDQTTTTTGKDAPTA